MKIKKSESSKLKRLRPSVIRHDAAIYLVKSHPDRSCWVSFGKDDTLIFWCLDDWRRQSSEMISDSPLGTVTLQFDATLVSSPQQLAWFSSQDVADVQGDEASDSRVSLLIGTSEGELIVVHFLASGRAEVTTLEKFANDRVLATWISHSQRYVIVRTRNQMYLLEMEDHLQAVRAKMTLEELDIDARDSFELIWHEREDSFLTIVDGGTPKAWEILKEDDGIMVLPRGALGDVYHFSSTLKKSHLVDGVVVTRNDDELRVIHWGTHTIESRSLIIPEIQLDDQPELLLDASNVLAFQQMDDDSCFALVRVEHSFLMIYFTMELVNGKVQLNPRQVQLLPPKIILTPHVLDVLANGRWIILGGMDGSCYLMPSSVSPLSSSIETESFQFSTADLFHAISLQPPFHESNVISISPNGKWLAARTSKGLVISPTNVFASLSSDPMSQFQKAHDDSPISAGRFWGHGVFPVREEDESLVFEWHPSDKGIVLAHGRHLKLLNLSDDADFHLQEDADLSSWKVMTSRELEAPARQMLFNYTGDLLLIRHDSRISVFSLDTDNFSQLKEMLSIKVKKRVRYFSWHYNAHLLAVLSGDDTIQVYGLNLVKQRSEKLDEFRIRADWFVGPLEFATWHPTDLVLIGSDARGNILTWRWMGKKHLEFLGRSTKRIHPNLGVLFQVLGESREIPREVRVLGFSLSNMGSSMEPLLVTFLLTPKGLVPVKEESLKKLVPDLPITSCINPLGHKQLYIITRSELIILRLPYAGRIMKLRSWDMKKP